MKIKDNHAETAFTDDPLNDLIRGGYIRPSDYLVDKDAEEVENAIIIIEEYFKTLEDNDLIEYG